MPVQKIPGASKMSSRAATEAGEGRFFQRAALWVAVITVVGFGLNIVMGRSSFDAPPLVHAHAVVFMGWVVIFVTQSVLATTGRIALHRRLGWLAAGWTLLMIGLGCAVTVAMVQRGGVPFFFQPLHFLVFDPLSVIAFAGLTWAAIAVRARTDWHRRLHLCATALLLGPALGRILPLPLFIPYAFEAAFLGCMVFILASVLIDRRRLGFVHPAWTWGVAAMLASLVVTEALAYSPAGLALYEAVARGTPGATVAPLAFPAPPGV